MHRLVIVALVLTADACAVIETGGLAGTVNCTQEGLSAVPLEVSRNTSIVGLLIAQNALTEIAPGMFSARMARIDVSYNLIRVIRRHSFVNTSLTTLQLTGNFITAIETDAFVAMSLFRSLVINKNTPVIVCIPGTGVFGAGTANGTVYAGASDSVVTLGRFFSIDSCATPTTEATGSTTQPVLITTTAAAVKSTSTIWSSPAVSLASTSAAPVTGADAPVVTVVWIGVLVGAATGAVVFLVLRRGCGARPARILDKSPEPSIAVTETVTAWDIGIYELGAESGKETENPLYDNRPVDPDEADNVYTEIAM